MFKSRPATNIFFLNSVIKIFLYTNFMNNCRKCTFKKNLNIQKAKLNKNLNFIFNKANYLIQKHEKINKTQQENCCKSEKIK